MNRLKKILKFAKTLNPKLKIAILVTLLLLFFLLVACLQSLQRRPEPVAEIQTQPPATIDTPIKLKIPKIGVDATIEQVGLTVENNMDVPKQLENVGWLNSGPHPGEVGSAVISGHLDGKNGEKAVFFDLEKLAPKDTFSIADNKGTIINFEAKETRYYDFDQIAPEVFTSTSGKHLNLITCASSWNKAKKSYEKRFVVFGDIIE